MAELATEIRVGTAGWSVPRDVADRFPETGSALERYSARLSVAEVNSSFYRPHRRSTYERWRDSVTDGFRFSVKLPKLITHERRLVDVAEPLAAFLDEIAALGEKLGPILIQLPPSLAFDDRIVSDFAGALRSLHDGHVVCEPRHPSWFEPQVDETLSQAQIARVAADPALTPAAALPGGWPGLIYHRLHGAPRIYYSGYEPAFLDRLASTFTGSIETWCVFDNTASGAAAANALALQARL